MKQIQVFEHQTLYIGDQGFSQKHHQSLAKYNDQHQRKYFSVGHKRIKFSSYVGVIKTGNTSIEILPKIDKKSIEDNEPYFWQQVLIKMLQVCRVIKTHSDNKADLKLRSNRLLDVIYRSFLAEVTDILHKGKVKQYRTVHNNVTSLKGRLNFPKHITHNLIHKQRFFTEHQSYDFNNIFNIALKKALGIVSLTSLSQSIVFESKRLLVDFEEVEDRTLESHDFDTIHYGRNTEKYRNAIELAKLIILNHQPDMITGNNNVIALLFDMNILFEEYVYRLLNRTAFRDDVNYKVKFQKGKRFWNERTIRPDILLKNNEKGTQYIIDTKWKIPQDNRPTVDDLKQMFVYNIQFVAQLSCLVYPDAGQSSQDYIPFVTSKALREDFDHGCQILFLNIFDEHNELNPNAAEQIYENFEKHNREKAYTPQ